MLSVDGQVHVRCTRAQAWALFTRFEDIARLIPSVNEVEVHGDRVLAKVCVKLGILPVTSRVVIEVTERKQFACIKASGISYLGETIVDQLASRPLREIDADSVGRLDLHLDLRDSDRAKHILLVYVAGVEAEGRLKKIYQSILKTKAPAMMAEFAENIRSALESSAAAEDLAAAALAVESVAAETPPQKVPSTGLVSAEVTGVAAVWRSFVAWVRALFRR